MPEPALAQQVELVQAHVLALQHADLRHRESLRRTEQRGEVRHGLLRDHDAARVDAQMVRHADEALAVADHRLRHLVQLAAAGVSARTAARVVAVVAFAKRIDLCWWKPHRFAQFAYGPTPLEGGVGGDLRRMDPARTAIRSVVLIEHVAVHLVAVFPAEVDVEVGRLLARGVDEALEVEVQLHRVHIGDAQAIGHQAVRPAAAPHVEEAPAARMVHDVLVDEEVADEAHLLDHVQLVPEPRHHLRAGRAVAVLQAFQRIAVQLLAVRAHIVGEGRARLVAAIEGDGAFFQQALGVVQQLRPIAVDVPRLFRVAEELIGFHELLLRQHAHHGVLCHGAQQAVRVPVALRLEGHRHQRHQFLQPARPRREGQARELARLHAHALVGP